MVGQSLVHFGGQACYDAFESAASAVQSLVDSGEGSNDWARLEKDFVTCSPIEDIRDMNVMLSDLMGNVQGRLHVCRVHVSSIYRYHRVHTGTIQYNNEHNGIMNVTDICPVMTASSNAYQQFVELAALYRDQDGLECEDASWSAMLEW